MTKILLAMLAGSSLFNAAAATAAVIVLDAEARGRYETDGTTFGSLPIQNYIVGDCRESCTIGTQNNADTRNWFRFDLSAIGEIVTGATVLLDVPAEGFSSSSAESEIYTLFDISAASGAALGSNSVAVWQDLGSGTEYGAHSATDASEGTTVSIVLNSDALAAVNAALGADFAFGGAITSLNTVADDEFLFGSSFGAGARTRLRLVTQSVPEPSVLGMLALALAGLGLKRRKRLKA